MKTLLDLSKSTSEKNYHIGKIIKVNDLMLSDYYYKLTEPIGKNYHPDFKPELTPPEMLKLGIFEGKYLNDCTDEFPKEWYEKALDKLSKTPNEKLNYFKVKSRQPLSVWIEKEWIIPGDPDIRGWFQWYCRYYLGRRSPEVDLRQIKRWKAFTRHLGQIHANCLPKDLTCRPRQRQALLQWAYNPFV